MNEIIKEVIDFTATSEGFSDKVYKCPAGKDTIGYGRNIEAHPFTSEELLLMGFDKATKKENIRVSKDLAKQWLEEELIRSLESVSKLACFEKLSTRRKAVLVDMCYNMGLGRLKGFKKFFKALEDRNYIEAGAEMQDSAWYNQVGDRAMALRHTIENDDPLVR